MYNELDIVKLHEMLKNGEITSEELVQESLKKSKDIEEKMNDVIEFSMIQELTNLRDELTQQLESSSERWMELIEKEE